MNFWEMAYSWGWATIEQLRLATRYNDLTPEEFEKITGEAYELDGR